MAPLLHICTSHRKGNVVDSRRRRRVWRKRTRARGFPPTSGVPNLNLSRLASVTARTYSVLVVYRWSCSRSPDSCAALASGFDCRKENGFIEPYRWLWNSLCLGHTFVGVGKCLWNMWETEMPDTAMLWISRQEMFYQVRLVKILHWSIGGIAFSQTWNALQNCHW